MVPEVVISVSYGESQSIATISVMKFHEVQS